MKGCKNELCAATPHCMLERYCIIRRKNTLHEKAELAMSFDLLSDGCPIAGNLAKKYAKELASSQRALQRLRTKRR